MLDRARCVQIQMFEVVEQMKANEVWFVGAKYEMPIVRNKRLWYVFNHSSVSLLYESADQYWCVWFIYERGPMLYTHIREGHPFCNWHFIFMPHCSNIWERQHNMKLHIFLQKLAAPLACAWDDDVVGCENALPAVVSIHSVVPSCEWSDRDALVQFLQEQRKRFHWR